MLFELYAGKQAWREGREDLSPLENLPLKGYPAADIPPRIGGMRPMGLLGPMPDMGCMPVIGCMPDMG